MSNQSGTELKRSKYRLLGLIGQGQFGQVFCAVHRQTGRLVALKNLEHERFPTYKFLRELRFLLSFQHPNIVTCQALEHTATGRYLVMDYCEGGTLRNLMTEESRLSLIHSLKLVADVLAGLDHAHNRGIVHCDIKPENILLHVHSGGWLARISDFGIARLSREMIRQDSNTGSPAYMAPERFYGQYSVASDLYSVGILLFELITGYRPFSGTPAELMSAHLNTPPKMPDAIPEVWQPFIVRSLQKLPARRFRSAGEMLSALQEIAATEFSEAWVNLPAKQTSLFYSVVLPSECLFQPLRQDDLSAPITALAASSRVSASQLRELSSACVLYQAAGCRLSCLVDQTCSLLIADAESAQPVPAQPVPAQPMGWQHSILTSERIEQLLICAQGCLVVMHRSIKLLPLGAEDRVTELQPITELDQESMVAVDPEGHWLASLNLSPVNPGNHLALWQLPGRRRYVRSTVFLEPLSIPVTSLNLLALDSQHLAIVSTHPPRPNQSSQQRPDRAEAGTTVQVITRRGSQVGTLYLPLRLQQMILTPVPYRLLATEADHPGTVLLVDLKPYRIKRIWVEITPAFLAATPWGYILAELEGRIVFVDQEGRKVGAVNCPAPITAMTSVMQHGLLIATWKSGQGQLYQLDLRTLGLDLVF